MIQDPKTNNRARSKELDEILGKRFSVLDDGFVRVVEYMGTDDSIVQAARVSYGRGTKKVHEDRGLIRYLLRHEHTTPFEMCEIKFHVRVPMDCWRQWIRHRTANVNEYSTRYSEAIDSVQQTPIEGWRKQSSGNRQGSDSFLDSELGGHLSAREVELHRHVWEIYQERLANDVAREQARKDLLWSTYTEAYWKIDLHNLFHFLQLRMNNRAQHEIRSYANIIGYEIVARWCPIAWRAFLDYRVNALSLSQLDKKVIAEISRGNLDEATKLAIEYGWIGERGLKRNREREELEAKLGELALPIPWKDDELNS